MSPRTTPQSSPTKSQNEKADNDLDVALNKLSTLDPKVSFSPYLQRTNAEQRAKQKAKGFQGTVMIAPILKELSNKEKEKKRKTAHKRKAPPRQKTNPEVDEEDKEKEGSGSANEQETDQTGKSEALEEDWVKVIREEKINQKADNAEEIRKDLKEKVLDIRRKREQHRHYLEICREEEMLSSILRHNRSPQEQKRLRELRKQRAQLEKEQEDNASEKDDSEGNDPPQNRDGSLDDEYDADRGQRTPTDLDTQPQTQTQDDVDEQLKEPQNEEMESESAKEQENEEQEEVG
ncbi:hypothetical protein BLNAU_14191 [Blattamonas nauphoetae]|uniref:Uncharacterized protein n=1 Tax=Blattamonas nauphoetae TaxID=2049346 RepID=A0ABQ9XJA3_9EUKA|nr:hypothetical protein BLNAU_14191 [Blattamonas nauphoetae]